MLGVLLALAGTAYLASSFATLITPQYEQVVARATLIFKMGELPMVVWLLVGASGAICARSHVLRVS